MDNTKEFINMCEKADKYINSNWEDGDYIHCPDLNKTIIYNFVYTNVVKMGLNVIKLYRQDQLQRIVKEGNTTDLELLNRLAIMAKGKDYLIYKYDWSMEQLWLAFVMKEKFNKTWSRGDWV